MPAVQSLSHPDDEASSTLTARILASGATPFDATTAGDKIACFSNRSACNALAAPGRLITAPGMGGGLSTYTGTSQASPHCAGVAALMCQRARFATLTPATIVSIMKSTGLPTVDPAFTAPNPMRVNALAAVLATPMGVPGLTSTGALGAATVLLGLGTLALVRRRRRGRLEA